MLPSLAISETARSLRARRRDTLRQFAMAANVPPAQQQGAPHPPPPQPPVPNAGVPQAAANAAAPDALAAALQALAGAIANLQNQGGNPPPNLNPNVLDPFNAPNPFDLSSRAGSYAFATASAALDELWDGTIEKFPAFIISLRVRASEVRWNAAAPQGIMSYTVNATACNLLTEYHSIPEADLEAARLARADPRAIQNSKALYKCLKSSITGDLKAILFDQAGNLPTTEDGPLLFKKLTSFTMAASLQLSMMSFKNIIDFDPAAHGFSVPLVNTKLNHLFVLATTRERRLQETEKIQHTLTVYDRIKQPETWAQWVRIQVDRFDDGAITNCQDFMNSGALKYQKISSSSSGFSGSSSTLAEDIVAMVASTTKRKTLASSSNSSNSASTPPPTTGAPKKVPPFVKHFKSSSGPDATIYKVGDTKEFNGQTYHFCDCTTHRDRIKWHTHPASTCRTRLRWLQNKDAGSVPPIANIADTDSSSTPSTLDDTSTVPPSAPDPTDVTALLSSALTLTNDHPAVAASIADALNAFHDS